MLTTQFSTTPKIIRTDNGTEFVNSTISFFLQSYGILHQKSCPYTPQQNGVVERKHRQLLNIARAIRFQSHLPKRFWGECLLTATFLTNRLPTSTLNWKSPYEELFQRKPDYTVLKTFGCLAFASNLSPHKDKFDSRAITSIFVGYPSGQKGYKLFDLNSNTLFVSRDVVFHEHNFPFVSHKDDDCVFSSPPTPPSPFFDDSFSSPHVSFQPIEQLQNDNQFSLTPSFISQSPNIPPPIPPPQSHRKSTRLTTRPAYLNDYVVRYPLSNFTNSTILQVTSLPPLEPVSYAPASKYVEWVDAMQKELDALEQNQTWVLTDLPPGKKAIGSKWVFKVKLKPSGDIERYKARFVARGYNQIDGLDYYDSFSPVAKLTTVRLLIAIAISKLNVGIYSSLILIMPSFMIHWKRKFTLNLLMVTL
ncbi:hypothetical protein Scep_030813 [Stephania cephalantha]|uniref:Integrase catalytic domain-containing protein n=1 Tax=Stephania cephalantha TaxID=152367 RepID=A0AAP0HGU7_9MAGN